MNKPYYNYSLDENYENPYEEDQNDENPYGKDIPINFSGGCKEDEDNYYPFKNETNYIHDRFMSWESSLASKASKNFENDDDFRKHIPSI